MRTLFFLAAIAATAEAQTLGDKRLIDVQTYPGTPGRRIITETPGTPGRRITTYEEILPAPATVEERYIEPAAAAPAPIYRQSREPAPAPPAVNITVIQRRGLLGCLLGRDRVIVRLRR